MTGSKGDSTLNRSCQSNLAHGLMPINQNIFYPVVTSAAACIHFYLPSPVVQPEND